MGWWYDAIEAVFVGGCAWFSFKSAARIYIDRELKGTYWPSWVWYLVYELWRLPYYWHFKQWFSLAVGLALVATSVAAIYMIVGIVYGHDAQL